MFEQLVTETASRFNLPTASVSALVRGLLSLMTNGRLGGIEGFVDQFRRAGLGEVVTSWFGGREGRAIAPAQVEAALGPGTLDRLAGASGLTRAMTTSVLTFLLPKLIGRITPNGTLPSTGALQSQVSGYTQRPAPVPMERETRRGGWSWLPWAAAALVALVGWLWFRGPAGTIDPQLTVANRDGKVTYSGLVRDERTQTDIVDALRATFGEDNIDGHIRTDRNVKRATWVPRLGELFGALRTPGVELSLNGDNVGIGGWLSAADRQALGERIRGIFGPQVNITSLGDPASAAVREANEQALSELGAIGTSGASIDSVVRAMNMAIINFPSGSAEIPAESMAIIRKSAEALKQAPSGASIEIAGHTDDRGDSAGNLALSQARADAVKQALVEAGVPESMLTARGYGDAQSRVSNDTELGRFQNRRIEYRAMQ